MKRRSFLKGLVGGAVAAPATAKEAIDAAASELSLGASPLTNSGLGPIGSGPQEATNTVWAKDDLRRILKLTPDQHRKRMKRAHISALDPNVASLRSVALHRKIAITKRLVYNAEVSSRKDYLQSVIDGLL